MTTVSISVIMAAEKAVCLKKGMHDYKSDSTLTKQLNNVAVLSPGNEMHIYMDSGNELDLIQCTNSTVMESERCSKADTQCNLHGCGVAPPCTMVTNQASCESDHSVPVSLSHDFSPLTESSYSPLIPSVPFSTPATENKFIESCVCCKKQNLPRIPSVVISESDVPLQGSSNGVPGSTEESVQKSQDITNRCQVCKGIKLVRIGESSSSVESSSSDFNPCDINEHLVLDSQRSCDSAYSSSMDTMCNLHQAHESSNLPLSATNNGSMDSDEAVPAAFSSLEGSPNHKPRGLSVYTLRKTASSPFSSSSSIASDIELPPGCDETNTSSFSLKVESSPRKLSSSSTCSLRSSLSFEESEEDFPSSDENCLQGNVKRRNSKVKAQNSWTKIRRMVIWAPFMQSFKKKYPWVQLAGHAGSFQPGDEGCILKKYVEREAECLQGFSSDSMLQSLAPTFRGVVEMNGEKYTQMQDLLLPFDCPSLMDCKMGVRTYLEDELVKAKVKPRLRHDMYLKMVEVSPNEPTALEREKEAVTKPRYMQWREQISSTSNLGFRIEGIKKGDKEPSKNYKLTKTSEQVTDAFRYFLDGHAEALEKYIARLKTMRLALEESDFFHSHEVIGSSLLFVHDASCQANVWMIDFGKTTRLPNSHKLDHRTEWVEGNREDGYLFGMDNMIKLFEDILLSFTQQKLATPEESPAHRVAGVDVTVSPRTGRKMLRRQDARTSVDDGKTLPCDSTSRTVS